MRFDLTHSAEQSFPVKRRRLRRVLSALEERKPAASGGASLLLSIVFAFCVCGCQTPSTRVPDSLTAKFGGSDPDAQMDFWHQLTEKPLTSNDDAFHGLLLYMDGADEAKTYDERVDNLHSRNMLPNGFAEPGDVAVSRGTLAVAIMRLTGVKGGVTTRLFGASPRYAVRELMFAGLYPPSSPNQTFSGSEFVGIIGRIEDYQRGNPADVPAAVLPGEIEANRASTK